MSELTVPAQSTRPLRDGSTDVIALYNYDGSISAGDTAEIHNPDGELIVVRDVKGVMLSQARDVLKTVRLIGANYELDTTNGLLTRFNGFYDDDITLQSELLVVILEPDDGPT